MNAETYFLELIDIIEKEIKEEMSINPEDMP